MAQFDSADRERWLASHRTVHIPRPIANKLRYYKTRARLAHAAGRFEDRDRWCKHHDDLMLEVLREANS